MRANSSEHNLTLSGSVLLTEDEDLASLDDSEGLGLGLIALELKDNLLGVLGLLSQDWFGLSTESLLLHIVSSLTLGGHTILTFLVLGDFVNGVLLCLFAISSNRLWDMYHFPSSSLAN